MKRPLLTLTVSLMRCFLIFLAAVLSIGISRAEERPNIVVILSDDQGWGDLKLRALKIPGSQVMDFRLMLFTRVE